MLERIFGLNLLNCLTLHYTSTEIMLEDFIKGKYMVNAYQKSLFKPDVYKGIVHTQIEVCDIYMQLVCICSHHKRSCNVYPCETMAY